MIRKLQRKFVMITMLSLMAVMLAVIAGINGVNILQMNRKADGLLTILSENDGRFPKLPEKNRPPDRYHGFEMTAETPYETRYFCVRTDSTGAVTQIDTSHIAAVSSEGALEYAEAVLASGKTEGYTGDYKSRVTPSEAGSLLVFVDCRAQRQTILSFFFVSLAISAGCLLVVLILVSVFSKRAMRPVVASI